MKPQTRLQPSDLASQPKDGEPNFSPSNLLLATGAPPCRQKTVRQGLGYARSECKTMGCRPDGDDFVLGPSVTGCIRVGLNKN